jgi:hypothetical protein
MPKTSLAQSSSPVKWMALLLILLATALVVATIPPGDVHASPEPELSRAAASVVPCARPPDHAILPALPRWDAHLLAPLARIPMPTAVLPLGYHHHPTSRAPPMPLS